MRTRWLKRQLSSWLIGFGALGLCVTLYSLLPPLLPSVFSFGQARYWATRAVVAVLTPFGHLGLHAHEPWLERRYGCFDSWPYLLTPGVLAFVGLPSLAILILGILVRRRVGVVDYDETSLSPLIDAMSVVRKSRRQGAVESRAKAGC